MRATIDTLAADIKAILDEYEDDVEQLSKETVKAVAQKGKQALQSSARGTFGGTGKYASGWSVQVEETRMSVKATLYNGKVPGLPHLLEFGHAKRGGGRVSGRVHIKPVEDEMIEAFEQELRSKL